MVNKLSKKRLEILLEETPNFREPKRELEQYLTPSNVAASLLWEAHLKGDLGGIVYDLGCGTGKLTYGSLLMGAKEVICVDIDSEALLQARNFLKRALENPNVDFVQADVREGRFSRPLKECTVIMNPPFGVWSKKADTDFILTAAKICKKGYSIHKASEGFLNVLKSLEGKGYLSSYKVLGNVRMRLGITMDSHKSKSYYVNVYLLTFNSGAI